MRCASGGITLPTGDKFESIAELLEQGDNRLSVKTQPEIAGASRSSCYRWTSAAQKRAYEYIGRESMMYRHWQCICLPQPGRSAVWLSGRISNGEAVTHRL